MLPKMLEVGAEDSGLFYDFDSDKFFEPLSDTDPELTDVTSIIAEPSGLELDIPLDQDGCEAEIENDGDIEIIAMKGCDRRSFFSGAS